ncbi:tetratricopeptide repeat protein [Geomonas sp. RF6]|uniref:tetratricopeptide repeat protein n=1 Tax=Geomonas sp. RF6 TaxID=2897342 RepID=UPI001E5CB925|nr:tetratricopeptide repeat protein [Geomonas sp. RF6]UFS72440.1 tetratricopeptide repeat protein [Geomonas sp. RF6]
MSQLVCRPTGGAVDHAAQMPKITVLVAVRNEEAHLRECLTGLMEQSISDAVEVIVIDRASQQSEWAIVAEMQRRYDNITAVRTGRIGVCAAWNLGAKIASGRYLMVLEATDRLKCDALELLAAALDENADAMLAYGDTCFTTIPHESFERHTSFGKMIWPDYTVQQLSQISLVAPHPMWRRDVHDTIGWFKSEDEDAPLRNLMLQVVRRFRMLHVDRFTGLKLVASDSRLSPVAESTSIPLPETQPSQPVQAPAAEATPEEAYASIEKALQEGNEEGALQGLRRLVARYPDHATAHNDLAALSYGMGNVADAVEHYEAAVRLAPQESVFQKNLADIYFVEAGRTDEAIAIYLKLLQDSPRDVETLLNLGIISEAISHPAEAESFYQRGLEIEPWNQVLRERVTALRTLEPKVEQSAEERYAAAQVLVADGAFAEAHDALENLVAVFPDFALAHNDLAVLSYQSGEKEKALAHYRKAAELAPENSVFQKNLADFYFVEGDNPDGAIAIYLAELRKEPRNVETLMSLGKICEMLQREEEARCFYDRVLQLEPWNMEARESLKLVA